MANPTSYRQPGSSGRAGDIYLVFVGFSVALIGGLFVWLMARSYLRAKEMRNWPEVACVILSSELVERQHDRNSPVEFRHDVSFGYEWQGQPRTGDRMTLRGNSWSSKQRLMEGRLKELPPGKVTTCWVNPADPDFAVLKLDSLAPGYSIWFPSLFVIGGLGIVFRVIFKARPRSEPAA